MEKLRPKVGVGVIVKKDNQILLGKRKNAHGQGTWSPPGGHLELFEDVFACAKRETLEEAGIEIKHLIKGPFTNDIFEKENKHYITLWVISEYASEDVTLKEPKKCEQWQWFNVMSKHF